VASAAVEPIASGGYTIFSRLPDCPPRAEPTPRA